MSVTLCEGAPSTWVAETVKIKTDEQTIFSYTDNHLLSEDEPSFSSSGTS